jgi:hypothetical protein
MYYILVTGIAAGLNRGRSGACETDLVHFIINGNINFIKHVFFFCPNAPAFRQKKIIENVGRHLKRVVSCRAACDVEASTVQQ